MFYRALIYSTGEILESDSFSTVYRAAMRHAKEYVRESDCVVTAVVKFERAEESDYEYLNEYGYMQRDIINREHIAVLLVSRTVYTIVYNGRMYDQDREHWTMYNQERRCI